MMKEKTKTSKQRSLRTCATEDEILVAHILLGLPTMIRPRESGSTLKWGCKKRRSGFNDSSITPSSFQKTEVEIEERRQPQPKAAAAEEVLATASPVTPLAFSPSESDEKFRPTFKTSSRKRSREKYIGMIEELTQRRDLLRQEIGNVTKYHKKLIAYNSELKALKQEVLTCYQRKESESSNAGLELTQHLHNDITVEKSQPLAADHMPEQFRHSFGPIAAQFHSGLRLANHLGPLLIPDLNVSAEEMDLSQPFDMIADRRARFAEARRRRMDIIKINKSMKSASCGIKLVRSR